MATPSVAYVLRSSNFWVDGNNINSERDGPITFLLAYACGGNNSMQCHVDLVEHSLIHFCVLQIYVLQQVLWKLNLSYYLPIHDEPPSQSVKCVLKRNSRRSQVHFLYMYHSVPSTSNRLNITSSFGLMGAYPGYISTCTIYNMLCKSCFHWVLVCE